MQAANANTVDERAPAPTAHGIREQLGTAIGQWLAPVVGTIARIRHGRMFHPEGQVFAGVLEDQIQTGPYAELVARLGRTALVRLSAALSRNEREVLDVLGIAVRFHRGHKVGVKAVESDQDLLFATIPSVLALWISAFTTNAHDFLANRYYAVSPFEFGGEHRIEVRLTPRVHGVKEGKRAERLEAAVAAGEAVFALEMRRTLTLKWHQVATLRLTKPMDVDQAELRFDAFQDGAGLQPVGVVHSMRKAAYAASQKARKLVGG
jgi:hypothetical protein